MITYQITEEELRDIVQYGQEHPEYEFYIEPMNDGEGVEDEFLSCAFYKSEIVDGWKYPEDESGIWEFGYSSGEYDEE